MPATMRQPERRVGIDRRSSTKIVSRFEDELKDSKDMVNNKPSTNITALPPKNVVERNVIGGALLGTSIATSISPTILFGIVGCIVGALLGVFITYLFNAER